MSPSPEGPKQPLAHLLNPFARSVVTDPWDDTLAGDVQQINQLAFKKVLELIERVRSTEASTSMVISGQPGAGKTHLLARLRSHLERQPLDRSAIFAGVRLQTSPSMIWRHLRRETVNSIWRPLGGAPALRSILNLRRERIDQLEDRNVAVALEAIRDSVNVRDALAWLRGDVLPPAVAEQLKLSADPEDDTAEDRAYQVVKQLARLIAPLPMVICLDQVEAIQSHSADDSALVATGRFAAALHDDTRNVLLISCVQSAFLLNLERVIRGAHADRMLHQNRASLLELTWDQARTLIETRLGLEPGIAPLRPLNASALWPLEESRLRPLLAKPGESIARRIIHRCRDLWDEIAGRPPKPVQTRQQALRHQYSTEFESACNRAQPYEWQDAIASGLPLLLNLSGAALQLPEAPGRPRFADIVLQHPAAGPVAVALCNQPHANGLAAKLKRVAEQWDSRQSRLVLLRDSRLGISANARATRARFRTLVDSGAAAISISPAAVAALDALRRIHASAASGDLSNDGETISAVDAEAWMRDNLDPSLRDLIESLTGNLPTAPAAATDPERLPLLCDFLAGVPVASLDQAALGIEVPAEEVLRLARENPAEIGLLEGPPPVLFALAGAGE